MDHLTILELHRIATELLHGAEQLNAAMDAKSPLKSVRDLLENLCKLLTRVCEVLSDDDSPLREVVRRVAGVDVSGALEKLERFLHDHRTAIESFGVSPAFLEKMMDALERQVDVQGENRLAKPQSLDPAPILTMLGEFRDLVCELSQLADAPYELLEGVVEGLMGTAIIVVDITGAATVAPHDFTGWTLLKVVKSVWSGTTMVRRAVGRLREALGSFRRGEAAEEAAERRQRVLKAKPPPSPFKKKP